MQLRAMIPVAVALGAIGAPPDTSDRTLVPGERAGAITARTDRAAVVNAFGSEAVEDRPFSIGEGFCVPGAVVFPGSPDEIEIAWQSGGAGVAALRVDERGGTWTTAAGIRVGTPLAELEVLNEAPFTFSGFGWDYGGSVGWRDGRLAATHGAGVRLTLGPDHDAIAALGKEGSTSALFGEQTIPSDHPLARRAGIRVTMIELRLGPLPDEEDCSALLEASADWQE